MNPPEQPQAPEPAPKPLRPSRIERFINSLDRGKKLLVAIGGLIFGIGAVLAAIQGLKMANGHSSPPPTPTTVSSLPPTSTVVSPPTPTSTVVSRPATSPPA